MPSVRLLGFLVILFLPLGIYAQAAPDSGSSVAPIFQAATFEELSKIAIVTTASKKIQKISEAPATVIVVTRQEILDRGYQNLVDVFRDLPGMEVDYNYFAEMGTLVPVRGVLGNNKIIFLVNGIRVNPPGGEYFPIHNDFSVRSAERIEIIYGPGSTLYGEDAISAVINLITVEPTETARTDLFLDGGLIDQGSTYGHTELGASFAKKMHESGTDDIGVLAYVQGKVGGFDNLKEEYPNYWEAAFGATAQAPGQSDPTQRWDDGFNALMRVTTRRTAFQAWHRESSRSTAEGANLPIYYVSEGVWHDRADVVSVINAYDFSDELRLESTGEFSRYEVVPDSRYVFPVNGKLFLNDYKYSVGTGTSLEEKLAWNPSERLSLIGGAAVTNDDIMPKLTIPGGAENSQNVIRDAGVFTYYTRRGDSTSRVDVSRGNMIIYQVLSAYTEGQLKVMEPLSLIAGVRVDANTRYSDIPVLPRLAAVYRMNKLLTAKYIFTQAYVSPAPYFSWDIFDNGLQLNTSNPHIRPEEALSNELNLNYLSDRLMIGASLFYNTNNSIIVVGDSRTEFNVILDSIWLSPDPGATPELLTHSVNSGKSRAYGFDLFGRFQLERLSLWASYSFVDYERTLPGSPKTDRVVYGLDDVSKHNVRAGVTARIRPNLTATLSGFLRSTPEGIEDEAAIWKLSNEVDTPYQLDAYLHYQPIQFLGLFLQVTNLTNHGYALKGITPTPSPQEKIKLVAGCTVSL